MLLLKLIKIFVFTVHMCEKIRWRIPIFDTSLMLHIQWLMFCCWTAGLHAYAVSKFFEYQRLRNHRHCSFSSSCGPSGVSVVHTFPYLLLHYLDKTNEQCELQLNVKSVRSSALDQKSFLDLSLQVLEVLTEKITRPNGLILLNWHNICVKPRINELSSMFFVSLFMLC